jgi:FKBP-type peptidyl-prolyl cis-trans isomerase
MQKAAKTKGAAAIQKGQKYLAENKTKLGVQTTASGLQYKIITAGTGAKPAATDVVRVNYKGMLTDGKVFDQSQPGQPAEFSVSQLIPAWTEALQMMPAGSKWQIVVPSNLAYGERGAGGAIGPNETLVFDMELLEIVKGGSKQAAPEPPMPEEAPR